jgi:hypothetical protein
MLAPPLPSRDPAGLRDRSKRPLKCPHEIGSEVVGKIIHLRQRRWTPPVAAYVCRKDMIKPISTATRIIPRI